MARIQDFRAVACVLRTGSVTAAARELGRSQPTVTRSLQRLEGDLGIQLFRRRPAFKPTTLGTDFLPYAQAVVAAADQALAAVGGLRGCGPSGGLDLTLASGSTGRDVEEVPGPALLVQAGDVAGASPGGRFDHNVIPLVQVPVEQP